MDLKKVFNELVSSINKNYIIVLFCNCEVEYEGRAKSVLGQGDRMVIIKHDNTLLVHKPDGRSPVNWMPQGSTITAVFEEGMLVIKASNLKPYEEMRINVFEAYSFTSAPLVDTEQLKLVGTEKDMSDMIYDNPKLISEKFIPLSREEQTEYGFLDVFGHDGEGSFIVVECKRYTAGLDSVTQLRRYVEKVKQSKGVDNVKGIMAAPNISSNALKMLTDLGFEYKPVKPPNSLNHSNVKQRQINEF
ncbi:MAG: endonuclease NucS [Nanoarchaeota archaeon]|nr:endonuclease NucS [Nanoarchaeota archaeon]